MFLRRLLLPNMGVVGELITGGTGLGQVVSLVQDVFDRVLPDKDAEAARQADILLKAQTIDAQIATAQAAIDQAEAASNSTFVSGARPFILWVCGFAFAYHMIVQPLLTYWMAVFGHVFPLPQFDSAMLQTTMDGMLGLAFYRSYEKVSDKGQLPWQK